MATLAMLMPVRTYWELSFPLMTKYINKKKYDYVTNEFDSGIKFSESIIFLLLALLKLICLQ
jgi:hypothetical protein